MSACPRVSIKTVFPGNCSRKMLFSQLIPPKQWHFLPPLGEGRLQRRRVALCWTDPKSGGPRWGSGVFPVFSSSWSPLPHVSEKEEVATRTGNQRPKQGMKARVADDHAPTHP